MSHKITMKGVHEVVSGPLGEERDGDHDPQTSPVSRGLDERQPANLGSLTVESERSTDLLELVLDKRVVPSADSVSPG